MVLFPIQSRCLFPPQPTTCRRDDCVNFLRTHGISVNADLLFEYLPKGSLGNITDAELGELLRKSSLLVESSPRMYRLRAGLDLEDREKFRSLPVSSGRNLPHSLTISPHWICPHKRKCLRNTRIKARALRFNMGKGKSGCPCHY